MVESKPNKEMKHEKVKTNTKEQIQQIIPFEMPTSFDHPTILALWIFRAIKPFKARLIVQIQLPFLQEIIVSFILKV